MLKFVALLDSKLAIKKQFPNRKGDFMSIQFTIVENETKKFQDAMNTEMDIPLKTILKKSFLN